MQLTSVIHLSTRSNFHGFFWSRIRFHVFIFIRYFIIAVVFRYHDRDNRVRSHQELRLHQFDSTFVLTFFDSFATTKIKNHPWFTRLSTDHPSDVNRIFDQIQMNSTGCSLTNQWFTEKCTPQYYETLFRFSLFSNDNGAKWMARFIDFPIFYICVNPYRMTDNGIGQ